MAGGIAATLFEKTGTWTTAFYGSAVLAFCAALLAIVIRKMPFPKKAPEPVGIVTEARVS
jgi:hypothetical protein